MSKHKHFSHHARRSSKQDASFQESLSQRGRNAFHAGRLGEAIEHWERAAKKHPEILPALAEAYFRRSLNHPTAAPDQPLHDLLRATELVPNDAIYYYHLALAHHRRGELDAALIAYAIGAGLPTPPRGLAFAMALAQLETDPNVEPSALNRLAENERALINTLAPLLRGDTAFARQSPTANSWLQSLVAKFSGADQMATLWRGLAHLLAGDTAAAQSALEPAQGLVPRAQALRHYYLGVLAARRGDWSAARVDWEQARARGLDTAWLRANLAAAHLPSAQAAVQAENWRGAVEHARAALRAQADHPTAAQVAVLALHQLANAAAHKGHWREAMDLIREANEIYAKAHKTDSTTRALLQNLAIASEQSEQWEQAAQSWRDLIRTKPRSKKAKDTFTDAQWDWMRRRAILDLQRAGQLAPVITLLKQKVKAEPKDIATRLELVEVLMANQKETAAGNELQRILEIDPQYAAARLKLAEWHVHRHEWHAAEQQMHLLLEQDPSNTTVRGRMANLMHQRGRSLHTDGRVAAAREVLEQAVTFAPDDVEIYIDLGRADLDLRRRDAARADFEQAYRIGGKKLATHEQIVRCWIIDRQHDEVEKAMARAETDLPPPLDPLFYVHTGLACFPPTAPNPFGPARAKRVDDEWEDLGQAWIERAVALKPDDDELLHHIVGDCLDMQLPVGAVYAERLTQRTPDDPLAWITWGFLRAMSGQVNEGKENLKHGARLARQQGLSEMEQMANDLRRELDTPVVSLASSLGLPLGALFGQPEEEEFEDADPEPFWTPPRRRRR